VYQEVLHDLGARASEFVMVGNSLRSDVLPVLDLGGRAVHVHYPLCWEHERVPEAELAGRVFPSIRSLGELVALVDALDDQSAALR
jgi:putative hydrolase of the HAD superfamily